MSCDLEAQPAIPIAAAKRKAVVFIFAPCPLSPSQSSIVFDLSPAALISVPLQSPDMICQLAAMNPSNENHWHRLKPPPPLAGWAKFRHRLFEGVVVIIGLAIWVAVIGAVLRVFGLWFW